jgi:hypothetical protein
MKKQVVLKTYLRPPRLGIVINETEEYWHCVFPGFFQGAVTVFSKIKDKEGRYHNIGNHAYWIEFDDTMKINNWHLDYG